MQVISALALGAMTACSLAVGAERTQCATSKDCVGHGLGDDAVCLAHVCIKATTTGDAGNDSAVDAAPADPIWGCLDNLPELPAEEPTAPAHFKAGFQNVVTTERLPGLPIKACKIDDTTCAQPIAGTSMQSDASGMVDVVLYSGFRGYLDISPSADIPDLMPSILTVLPLPDKRKPEGNRTVNWGLVTKAQMQFVAASAGKVVNPDYGNVFFFVSDCRGVNAAGAAVHAAPVTAETYTFYTDVAGTPSLTPSKTTASGNGGFMNLPVGSITLTLTLDDGRQVASHQIVVRKGTTTYLNFGPSR